MAMEKKATDKLGHIDATSIMNATVLEQYDMPLVTYMAKRDVGSATETKACSKTAFAGFYSGHGRRHPHLRNGLRKSHRFNFKMLVEKDANGNEIIVGAHAIPNDNFIIADMAAEFPGRAFAPENAVVNIKADTGEIDIHIIPRPFIRAAEQLVSKLETLSTITEGDVIDCGFARFDVQQINGSEVILDCRLTSTGTVGQSGLGR